MRTYSCWVHFVSDQMKLFKNLGLKSVISVLIWSGDGTMATIWKLYISHKTVKLLFSHLFDFIRSPLYRYTPFYDMRVFHVICLLCVATYRLDLFDSTTTKCSNCNVLNSIITSLKKKPPLFPYSCAGRSALGQVRSHGVPGSNWARGAGGFDQSGAGSSRDPQSGFQPAQLTSGGEEGAVAISDPPHLYPLLAPGNVVKLAAIAERQTLTDI